MTGRRKDEEPTGREAIQEIEARLGTLFGKLGETLSSLSNAGREAGGEAAREGMRVHTDLRVRVGGLLDGAADGSGDAARGPVRPVTPRGSAAGAEPQPAAPRTPIVEVHDGAEVWSATAELPGAEAEHVSVRAAGGRLEIVATGARPYRAELPLPPDIDPESIEHRLANGILEVRAARRPSGEAE